MDRKSCIFYNILINIQFTHAAKKRLKIFESTFRLACGVIVNATNLAYANSLSIFSCFLIVLYVIEW